MKGCVIRVDKGTQKQCDHAADSKECAAGDGTDEGLFVLFGSGLYQTIDTGYTSWVPTHVDIKDFFFQPIPFSGA